MSPESKKAMVMRLVEFSQKKILNSLDSLVANQLASLNSLQVKTEQVEAPEQTPQPNNSVPPPRNSEPISRVMTPEFGGNAHMLFAEKRE